MANIKIKFSLTFWVFFVLLVYMGQTLLLINYMLVLFLHEYAHAYVAYRLGYQIKDIRVIPFGISLNMQNSKLNPKDEFLIAISGPVVNIISAIIVLAVWWVFPITYSFTHLFCFASLTTALFNFLPCYPLDGGRVLFSLVSLKKDKLKSIKICKTLNLTISIFIFCVFLFSIFVRVNFTYLIISLFLFANIFIVNNTSGYDFLSYSNKFVKKLSCPIKQIAIKSSCPIYKLCTYINHNVIIHFVVMDNNKVIFSFYETELQKIYSKFNPTQTVGQIMLKNNCFVNY